METPSSLPTPAQSGRSQSLRAHTAALIRHPHHLAGHLTMEDELFDVFNETGAKPSRKEKRNKKRSLNGDIKSPESAQNGAAVAVQDQPMSGVGETEDDNENAHDQKRQRKYDEPEPVVTDEFETQQSREVAASAGLQAQKDDTAVVLSHQVRHQVSLPPDYDYVPISQHKRPEKPARTWPFTLDP